MPLLCLTGEDDEDALYNEEVTRVTILQAQLFTLFVVLPPLPVYHLTKQMIPRGPRPFTKSFQGSLCLCEKGQNAAKFKRISLFPVDYHLTVASSSQGFYSMCTVQTQPETILQGGLLVEQVISIRHTNTYLLLAPGHLISLWTTCQPLSCMSDRDKSFIILVHDISDPE